MSCPKRTKMTVRTFDVEEASEDGLSFSLGLCDQ